MYYTTGKKKKKKKGMALILSRKSKDWLGCDNMKCMQGQT